MRDEIAFAWNEDEAVADAAAAFFLANVDAVYISHGELQSGRADKIGRWNDNLPQLIGREARTASRVDKGEVRENSTKKLAVAIRQGHLVGIAFITFNRASPCPLAVVEDLIVDAAERGGAIGANFLSWIETESRALGVKRLLLESGLGNERAHHFFERRGFVQTSIVMMKDLY